MSFQIVDMPLGWEEGEQKEKESGAATGEKLRFIVGGCIALSYGKVNKFLLLVQRAAGQCGGRGLGYPSSCMTCQFA